MRKPRGRPKNIRKKAVLFTGILFISLLIPWLIIGNWYKSTMIRQERETVSAQASAIANSLVFSVNQRLALLQGLYAFTRTEWPSTDFDYPFEVFSSELYFKSNGISTIMVAPEGIARYVYPLYNARKLSGYDVINDPDASTRADVQRAIHTNVITLSEPGELPEGGLGLRAWRAVYRGSELWGLVSISLDLNTILQYSGLSKSFTSLDYSLRDTQANNFFGDDTVWQHDPVTQKIKLPEGSWELGVVPAEGWDKAVDIQVVFFRVASLVLLVFLAVIFFLVINRQEQQAKLAVLEERQRLARELHDSVSQVLYSIGLGAKSAKSALKREPDKAVGALDYIDRLAEGGQAEMRALIFELRPDSISADGLVAALERIGNVLHARHQMDVVMRFCEEPELPVEEKEDFYRVAQEAANNISKHSRASRVGLTLDNTEDELKLEVSDNGIGFTPDSTFPGHLGLRSMRERALKNGARLTIISSPGQGTKIEYGVFLKREKKPNR